MQFEMKKKHLEMQKAKKEDQIEPTGEFRFMFASVII